MNILLTNYSLSERAGSETWIIAMYIELTRRGHNVEVFTTRAPETNKLLPYHADKKRHYDLALVNHKTCLNALKSWNIDRRIYTSHGVMSDLCVPVEGADVYVSVSEEIRDHNKERYGIDSVIIRNPIDTKYFFETPVHLELTNILFLSNRRQPLQMIKAACEEDFNFQVCTGFRPASDVRSMIQWADLVITAGRGCYESLSCGKNVIVFTRFGADGIVTMPNIYELRKNNCSGRCYRYQWEIEDLREEFKRYDPGRNLRGYIVENNNVEKVVGEYLNL